MEKVAIGSILLRTTHNEVEKYDGRFGMSVYAEFEPFVYLIGWSKLNLYYIGSRFCNSKNRVAHPSQLWKSYFTSSKLVKETRLKNGDPDIIEIRKTFSTSKEANDYENRLLQRIGAVFDPRFLNRNDTLNFRRDGPFSDKEKQKRSIANKGKNTGPRSEETKAKIREKRKSQVFSEETREKKRLSMLGKNSGKRSLDTRQKMSAAKKEKPPVVCPHCGKIGAQSQMTYWHFDNCKFKEANTNGHI